MPLALPPKSPNHHLSLSSSVSISLSRKEEVQVTMRIRRRPQSQVQTQPLISPDQRQEAHVVQEGAVEGVLHPKPNTPRGCNTTLCPLRPSTPLDGRDLSITSHLHPPPPSRVDDEHKAWGLDGGGGVQNQIAAANGSGAETKLDTKNTNQQVKTSDSDVEWVMEKEDRGGGGHVKKRRRRRSTPAVLMEGSRCSRVNGRGWRCCQQTLVGYSLCEHHLGKGRLRSMNNVKCNGSKKKNKTKKEEINGEVLGSGVGDDDDDANARRRRRRRKIGMVKARSMSSLLDETNQASAMVEVPLPVVEEAPLPLLGNGAMV